jgi:hypothetical protein
MSDPDAGDDVEKIECRTSSSSASIWWDMLTTILSHESRTVLISFHAVSNCYCLTSMSQSLLLFVGLTTFA